MRTSICWQDAGKEIRVMGKNLAVSISLFLSWLYAIKGKKRLTRLHDHTHCRLIKHNLFKNMHVNTLYSCSYPLLNITLWHAHNICFFSHQNIKTKTLCWLFVWSKKGCWDTLVCKCTLPFVTRLKVKGSEFLFDLFHEVDLRKLS